MDALPPSELGKGVFPLREAARLAQLDTRTARRWALGYDYWNRGEPKRSPGLVRLILPQHGAETDLTFREMLTLRMVRGFRRQRLGLPTIKKIADIAAREYGESLPFTSKRFRTDGRKIFVELSVRPTSDGEDAIPARERRLIEVLTGQENFAGVVEASLFADVDWEGDFASRWWPLGHGRRVTLDPEILFGAPHVNGARISTTTIAKAVTAEGGGPIAEEAVSKWFGVSREAVSDACYFEASWLKAS